MLNPMRLFGEFMGETTKRIAHWKVSGALSGLQKNVYLSVAGRTEMPESNSSVQLGFVLLSHESAAVVQTYCKNSVRLSISLG